MEHIIIIGHGSPKKEANNIDAVCRLLHDRLHPGCARQCVRGAYLQFSEPDIPTAIRRSVDEGVDKIIIHPFFLSAGMHTTQDIPELIEEARSKYPGVAFVYTEPLGIHEKLISLVQERIMAAEGMMPGDPEKRSYEVIGDEAAFGGLPVEEVPIRKRRLSGSMRKGYIHVYTGDGKGKTTAAFGLALRAAGAGIRVLIVQFMKMRGSSEHKVMERFSDCITIKLFGTGLLLTERPTAAARKKAEQGLAEVRKAYSSSDYDIFILDEINVALHCGLLKVQDVLALMDEKPVSSELILTGRYADKKIIAKADLVTEMREIKHYFRQGVRARKGIEF